VTRGGAAHRVGDESFQGTVPGLQEEAAHVAVGQDARQFAAFIGDAGGPRPGFRDREQRVRDRRRLADDRQHIGGPHHVAHPQKQTAT
jgi:hypothetical protein